VVSVSFGSYRSAVGISSFTEMYTIMPASGTTSPAHRRSRNNKAGCRP
jgi:hypothetical protein